MKDTWTRLDEICDINMGQSPESDTYNQEEDGLPFFQGNADFGELYPTTRMWCNKPKKFVEKDTLLISVRAPIGALNFAKEKSCIGRGLAGLTGRAKINLKYIYYCLKNKNEELNRKGTGSTFKAINKGALGETKIKILSLLDQEECVRILDRVDLIINRRKEQLIRLDDLIKSRFVEMFGDIERNPYKWKEVTFGDISKVRQGLQIPISKRKSEPVGNCLPYITLQFLNGGKQAEYIEKPKETVICTTEDILMTRTGNTGMVISDVEGVFHNNFFLIDFDRTVLDKTFLVQYLKSNYIQADIIKRAGTSTIPDLNHGEFYKIKLYLPPLELQNQFATFVQQVDKLKFAVKQSLDGTQVLFDSLMQKYFG